MDFCCIACLPLSGGFLPDIVVHDSGKGGRAQGVADTAPCGCPCRIGGGGAFVRAGGVGTAAGACAGGVCLSFPYRYGERTPVGTIPVADRCEKETLLDALRFRPAAASGCAGVDME